MSTHRRALGSVIPYAVATALVALAAAYAASRYGASEEALASMVRPTARIAFVVFFLAFTASAWRTLVGTAATVSLVRNRRHIGLAFAGVHLLHLALLTAAFLMRGDSPNVVTIVGGGLAYVFLLSGMALAVPVLRSLAWSRRRSTAPLAGASAGL